MPQSTATIASLQTQEAPCRIVIAGAGIVGSALAHYLSLRTTSEIVVFDRSLSIQNGSTGHAPGFVGQLNESNTLTTLAKESVQAYRDIPDGFASCGGLEVATTEQGLEHLRTRLSLAHEHNLPASILAAEETVGLAPDFIRHDQAVGGLHFPSDGTANALRISTAFRSNAESRGVRFLEAELTGVVLSSSGSIRGVETSLAPLPCTSLVLATGIWTSHLIRVMGLDSGTPIPIIPVAHPYMYSRTRAPRHKTAPFIRWPESQIYARDHGPFDGLGSYSHAPAPIDDLASTALVPNLPDTFAAALETGAAHLPDESVFADPRTAANAINGIFAITPDNLPLLGPVAAVPGLYLAAAIWVTHAAGCARVLADALVGTVSNGVADEDILAALRPERFEQVEEAELRERALENYNHIYKSPGNQGRVLRANT